MQALIALSRGIDRVTEFVGKSVMWLIFLAIIISAGNAVMRKVFNFSSNAYLEMQWYLFGAAFLGAAAYTLQQNEHIRIDIFYGTRSKRTRHWIDLIGHVFFLMPFVILMTVLLVPYAWQAYRISESSSNSGGLLVWPARAILAAGFILLILQGISEIIKKVAVMQGLIDDPHPFVSAHEAAELEGAALAKEVAELEKAAGEKRS
ncbi:TRAP transporter small permease subunit [Tabrizicola sp.]|uniref:TRAP transporter small permease subunit n=1 Tax=Tabrizicola sp. TaxID=2005166 RepID=UPI00286CCCC4|nr:TRAP transporter small permease subunit [Tabrizicola sp.]